MKSDNTKPHLIFGIVEPKPPRGFPSQDVQFDITKNNFVVGRCGKRSWYVMDAGDAWEPCIEIDPPNTGLERTRTRSGSEVRSEPLLGSGLTPEKKCAKAVDNLSRLG